MRTAIEERPGEAIARVPHWQLPPEIWLIILEFLPPSFFQQDLRRLTLCKRWYSLAFPIFYRNIECTPRVISRLVMRKSESLDKARALLRKSLQCVNIVLDGIPGLCAHNTARYSAFNTSANLGRFCLMLLEFKELKTVRFTARWQNKYWRGDPYQQAYLKIRSLKPYMTVLTQITSLDLNLCGTDVVDDDWKRIHFCPHIQALISRVQTLRLTLRCICQTALWPLDDQPVAVGNLTVNLYLGRVSDVNPKLNSSRVCYPASPAKGWECENPIDQLRLRLKQLVKEMPSPQRAELVHLARSGELHTWNALTKVCTRDDTVKPRRVRLFRGWESQPCFDPNLDDSDMPDTDDGEMLVD
ncbi:hypothetical protein N656DRAFT_785190 [Canariomyces notabilis]|uniref:F-box domain-containing protein n=1 Tax=Canariomyces notabilis TaxID=2074819 RepID=A0AAN6QHK7_9PEZI|nr:hypothetical protein N656DRAFT_785190 [Canariomyces arenarius]